MTVEAGHHALVQVATATLWTSPTAPVDDDRLALGSHSAVRDWVAGMTREQRVDGLVDRTVSQVLLGDEVLVETVEDGWAKVVATQQTSTLDERGYPGWVPVGQLTTAVRTAEGGDHVVSATATSIRDEPDGEVLIPGVTLGTRLPVLDEEPYRGWSRVVLPGPQQPGWVRCRDISPAPGGQVSPASGRVDLMSIAAQLLDIPYVWGGLSAYGLDCSGLVHLAFRQLGIAVPRDAHDQAAAATRIPDEDAQPGDLYFFARPGKRIHHVGIVAAPQDNEPRMIHAAGNYGKVVEEAITAERRDTFAGTYRVFAE